MIPHFMLVRGKKEYLILRMGDVFHIIDADENLTKEKRLAILEQGCTPAEMQQMGLSGLTIPKSDIRSLTVTGCGSQDDVIFRLERQKLSYRFAQAYEQSRVDDFFRGIPRKQYKTRRRLKGGRDLDWRAREQDPAKLPRMRIVGRVWTVLCVAVAVCMPALPGLFDLWMLLSLVLLGTAVGLNSVFDLYFSMFSQGGKPKARRAAKTFDLQFGCVFIGVSALLCGNSRYALFEIWHPAVPALVITGIVGAALFFLCRECQEEIGMWALSMFMVFAVSLFAYAPWLNDILGPETTAVTVPITESRTSSGKGGRRYYCTVTFPDGRELDVRVNRELYETWQPGDTMDLQYGTGFFGFDYAIDE